MPFRRRSSTGTPGLFDTKPRRTEGKAAPSGTLTAHIDGGARGNPGPAGYGAHITGADGTTVAELSEYLGHRTNNFAEYSALLAALDYALAHGAPGLRVFSDSELLVRQMNGQYKVKHPELRTLFDQAKEKTGKLRWFEVRHVRREQNREADRLANEAMDRGPAKKA